VFKLSDGDAISKVTVADESGNEVDPTLKIVAKPGKYNISVFDAGNALLPNTIEITLSSGEPKVSSQTPLDNADLSSCGFDDTTSPCQFEIKCPNTLLEQTGPKYAVESTKVNCTFNDPSFTDTESTIAKAFVADGGAFSDDSFSGLIKALNAVFQLNDSNMSLEVKDSAGGDVTASSESKSGSYTVQMITDISNDPPTYQPIVVNLHIGEAGDILLLLRNLRQIPIYEVIVIRKLMRVILS